MLLATADHGKVARIDYHHLAAPEALQAWLLSVLDEDGVVVADELRARVALRQTIRAAGRDLLADDDTPHGRQRRAAITAAIDAAGSTDLAPAKAALAQWAALEHDDTVERVDAKVLAWRLLEACKSLGVEAPLLATLTAVLKGGRLKTTVDFRVVQACLRSLARQRAAAKAPTGELRRELEELGVTLPSAQERK